MAGRQEGTDSALLWEKHYTRRYETLQRSLKKTGSQVKRLEMELGRVRSKNMLGTVANLVFGGRYGRIRALNSNGRSTAKLEKEHQAACRRMELLQRELEELQAEVAANAALD
jgi:hypothetical protein